MYRALVPRACTCDVFCCCFLSLFCFLFVFCFVLFLFYFCSFVCLFVCFFEIVIPLCSKLAEKFKFSFLFDWNAHLKRYTILKTPLESVQWFQGYEHLKGSQNNRKQKKLISFSGYISQSMLPSLNWSR